MAVNPVQNINTGDTSAATNKWAVEWTSSAWLVPSPDTNNQTPPWAQTLSATAWTETVVTWQGPLGAPNKYTWGAETINPTVPVNTWEYSTEAKQKMVRDAGYTYWGTGWTWNDVMKANVFSRWADGSLQMNEDELKKLGFSKATTTPWASATPTETPQPTETAPSAPWVEDEKKRAADLAAETKANADAYNAETERAKAAQEALAAQQKALLEKQAADLQALSTEFEQKQKEKLARYEDTVRPQLIAEQEYNKANLAKAQVDQDAAIQQAKIDQEVARAQAAISLGKLGLTLSTSGITQVQQIFTQGATALAKVKVDGAVNLAWLKAKIVETEMNHALKINAAIDSANEAILSKKEQTIKDIFQIQNNIILTDKEKEQKINALTKDMLSHKQETAQKLYTIARESTAEVERLADKFKSDLTKKQTEKKTEVTAMMNTGFWHTLTPTQKAQYEKEAWLVAWQASSMADSTTTEALKNALEYIGKDFWLSIGAVDEDVLANAKIIIDSKLKLWIPLNQAIAAWVRFIGENDKQFKEAYAQKLDMSKLSTAYQKAKTEAEKAAAQIELNKAKTVTEKMKPQLISAQIKKYGADAAKAIRSWTATNFGKIKSTWVDAEGNFVHWMSDGKPLYPVDDKWNRIKSGSSVSTFWFVSDDKSQVIVGWRDKNWNITWISTTPTWIEPKKSPYDFWSWATNQ